MRACVRASVCVRVCSVFNVIKHFLLNTTTDNVSGSQIVVRVPLVVITKLNINEC